MAMQASQLRTAATVLQWPFHGEARAMSPVILEMKNRQMSSWKLRCSCSQGLERLEGILPKESAFPVFHRMPLHYPTYSKVDYEAMPEWRLDLLLQEYGLPVAGSHIDKRNFAMNNFLFPDQLLAEEEDKGKGLDGSL